MEGREADGETLGLVRLSDSSSVTDSTGMAVPTSELNASLEGTIANETANINMYLNETKALSIWDVFEDLMGNTLAGFGATMRSGFVQLYALVVCKEGNSADPLCILKSSVRPANEYAMLDLMERNNPFNFAGKAWVSKNGTINTYGKALGGYGYYIIGGWQCASNRS